MTIWIFFCSLTSGFSFVCCIWSRFVLLSTYSMYFFFSFRFSILLFNFSFRFSFAFRYKSFRILLIALKACKLHECTLNKPHTILIFAIWISSLFSIKKKLLRNPFTEEEREKNKMFRLISDSDKYWGLGIEYWAGNC